MLIGLVFTLGCIIGAAESKCKDIVKKLSNQCGAKRNGGVCCDYKNRTVFNDEVPSSNVQLQSSKAKFNLITNLNLCYTDKLGVE